MIGDLRRLMQQADKNEMRWLELEHRFRHYDIRSEMVFEFISLQFEATEADYQDRLEKVGLDDIKKYTLAEVESMRFMSDRQFNNMRASKK